MSVKKDQKVRVAAKLTPGTICICPEDRDDALRMLKALDLCGVIWDVQQLLRSALKHGHIYSSADEALEDVQKQLYGILADKGINLDELYK